MNVTIQKTGQPLITVNDAKLVTVTDAQNVTTSYAEPPPPVVPPRNQIKVGKTRALKTLAAGIVACGASTDIVLDRGETFPITTGQTLSKFDSRIIAAEGDGLPPVVTWTGTLAYSITMLFLKGEKTGIKGIRVHPGEQKHATGISIQGKNNTVEDFAGSAPMETLIYLAAGSENTVLRKCGNTIENSLYGLFSGELKATDPDAKNLTVEECIWAAGPGGHGMRIHRVDGATFTKCKWPCPSANTAINLKNCRNVTCIGSDDENITDADGNVTLGALDSPQGHPDQLLYCYKPILRRLTIRLRSTQPCFAIRYGVQQGLIENNHVFSKTHEIFENVLMGDFAARGKPTALIRGNICHAQAGAVLVKNPILTVQTEFNKLNGQDA